MQNIVFPDCGGTDSRGDEVSATLAMSCVWTLHWGGQWWWRGGGGQGFGSLGIHAKAPVCSPACNIKPFGAICKRADESLVVASCVNHLGLEVGISSP